MVKVRIQSEFKYCMGFAWRGFSPVRRWIISKACFTILTVINFLPENMKMVNVWSSDFGAQHK